MRDAFDIATELVEAFSSARIVYPSNQPPELSKFSNT